MTRARDMINKVLRGADPQQLVEDVSSPHVACVRRLDKLLRRFEDSMLIDFRVPIQLDASWAPDPTSYCCVPAPIPTPTATP